MSFISVCIFFFILRWLICSLKTIDQVAFRFWFRSRSFWYLIYVISLVVMYTNLCPRAVCHSWLLHWYLCVCVLLCVHCKINRPNATQLHHSNQLRVSQMNCWNATFSMVFLSLYSNGILHSKWSLESISIWTFCCLMSVYDNAIAGNWLEYDECDSKKLR